MGGPAGDLYIVINVSDHKMFIRKGDDLHMEIPVTIREAYLGGKIDVPTFDGKVDMKLPAKTQSGRKLRLKGKGMPGLNGKKHGDLYIKTKIVFPGKMNKKKQKQFEEFLEDYDENPREKIVV